MVVEPNRTAAANGCAPSPMGRFGQLYPSYIIDFTKFGYTEVLFPWMDVADDWPLDHARAEAAKLGASE